MFQGLVKKATHRLPQSLQIYLAKRFLKGVIAVPHSTSKDGVDSSSGSGGGGGAAPFCFWFGNRLSYLPFGRVLQIKDFIAVERNESVTCVARTFTHEQHSNLTVTLIPLLHVAHPSFFKQVDLLCRQHQSVLCEGRCPLRDSETKEQIVTVVPPREMATKIRPMGHEDDEGWEPAEPPDFWQPFSWGVIGSSCDTVVHAADLYDYERLPWWCSLRFNVPIIGGYQREKHCFGVMQKLFNEAGYKSFAVPWGVFHMPIMAEMLRRNGFTEASSSGLVPLRYVDGHYSASLCREMFARISWVGRSKLVLQFVILFLSSVYFGRELVSYQLG